MQPSARMVFRTMRLSVQPGCSMTKPFFMQNTYAETRPDGWQKDRVIFLIYPKIAYAYRQYGLRKGADLHFNQHFEFVGMFMIGLGNARRSRKFYKFKFQIQNYQFTFCAFTITTPSPIASNTIPVTFSFSIRNLIVELSFIKNWFSSSALISISPTLL